MKYKRFPTSTNCPYCKTVLELDVISSHFDINLQSNVVGILGMCHDCHRLFFYEQYMTPTNIIEAQDDEMTEIVYKDLV